MLHGQAWPSSLQAEQDRHSLDHQGMSFTTHSHGMSTHRPASPPEPSHPSCQAQVWGTGPTASCSTQAATRSDKTMQVPPHGPLAFAERIQGPLDHRVWLAVGMGRRDSQPQLWVTRGGAVFVESQSPRITQDAPCTLPPSPLP